MQIRKAGWQRWIWLGPIAAVLLAGPVPGAAQLDGSYLHRVECGVETPHQEWAPRLAGGPVRVLFVVPRSSAAREVVELAERLDLAFAAVTVAHSGEMAWENVYESSVSGTSKAEKKTELLRKLEAPSEVIVLANASLTILPAEAQYRILEQVAGGAGLVFVYAHGVPYPKLFAKPTPDVAQAVLTLAAERGLPEKAVASKPAKGKEFLQFYAFGKGRVAQVAYAENHSTYYGGLGLTFPQPYSLEWPAHYENNLVLISRVLLAAAGRLPATGVDFGRLASGGSLSAEALQAEMPVVTVTGVPAQGCQLRLRLRDGWNRVVWSGEKAVQPGAAGLRLQWPRLGSGSYFLDAFIQDRENKVLNFGYTAFDVSSAAGAGRLEFPKETWERREPVQGTVTWENPLANSAVVRLRLLDSPYRRVWAESTTKVSADTQFTTFRFDAGLVPTLAGWVTAEVTDDHGFLCSAARPVFFPEREIELFPTVYWDSIPGFLPGVFAQQVIQGLGWRAGLGHPSAGGENARLAALFDQRFVPYMTRIGLGVGKDSNGWTVMNHWLGVPAKDTETLKGDQSFYNPATQTLLRREIDNRIRNLPLYGPLIYTLGDENYFSFDAGYSPSDDTAFRAFLRRRYGDVASLNREWGSAFASFEVVKHLREAECRETRNLAAWNDHRQFMEQQYADVHHFLADCIRTVDPRAKVGAEGSVPGDLEKTIEGLEFWGPYSDPVMDEVLRCLGADKTRTLWWGGYTGSHGGRNAYPYSLWRPLLLGTVNGNSWYTATPASSDGFLGADFAYADYFRAMWPRLEQLQRGVAQQLIVTPLKPHGMAILWSHTSHSVATMDERCFSPEDSAAAVLGFAYRQGLNVEFVSSRRLGQEDALAPYRLLFLCGASALSETEVAAIDRFVRNGGLVVADLNPGVLNGFCRWLPVSGLSDLFGVTGMKGEAKFALRPLTIESQVRNVSLHFTADKVLSSPELPLFTVREQGKGTAILLNFGLSSAAETAAAATPFDRFMLALVSAAGIRPEVTVTGLTGQQHVIRVREDAAGQVLGILAEQQSRGNDLRVQLATPAWVVRADGKRLGKVSEWREKIDDPFLVYSLFTAEPVKPIVRLDRDRVRRGEPVAVDLSGCRAGTVLRIECVTPAGTLRPKGMTVAHVAAKPAPLPIRFALSDMPGHWCIRVTDVRSGLSREFGIQVH